MPEARQSGGIVRGIAQARPGEGAVSVMFLTNSLVANRACVLNRCASLKY